MPKQGESLVGRQWFFDRIEVLSHLTAKEKGYMLQQTRRRDYGRGTCIFRPGDLGVSVYMIQEGKVKIYNLTELGQEVTYWYIYPGDLFGLAEVCGGKPRVCFAEAVLDTVALETSNDCLRVLIDSNPRFAQQIIKVLGARLRQACDTITELASSDVTSRLAHLLIKLAQISGAPHGSGLAIVDKFTHQALANMIGASRQTVTETLNRFKEEGIISVEGRQLILTRPDRFAHLISHKN